MLVSLLDSKLHDVTDIVPCKQQVLKKLLNK